MYDEIDVERKIDEICNLYETLWSNGQRPRLGSMLETIDESGKESLLRALINVDIELRIKSNESVDLEEYKKQLESLPKFNSSIEEFVAHMLSRIDHTETKHDDNAQTHPAIKPPGNDEIAGFRLIEQIGQGGMGTVWKAEQYSPLRRTVAIKVVRAELGAPEVITRFEAERQALALMEHPNIARILDGGVTEQQHPWFAMEMVNGKPVVDFCDQNNLSIRERIELCIQICNAVQHAHQKGIMHRDLKPSNVLVTESDGQSIVKVIDFGLAKALGHASRLTADTLATEFGQVLGTLQYMSPEQAAVDQSLDVDTRTDVYAIGAILYELLTGSTPLQSSEFKNRSLPGCLEFIRNHDVSKPSSRLKQATELCLTQISNKRSSNPGRLLTLLSGDLDWVVMKAISADCGRRYQSASGLAEDLQRHLDDDPVVARPPSFVYRAKKFVHKNRTPVVVASLLFASLATGLAMTYWQMLRAIDAESLSETRRVNAVEAKNLAEANAVEAEKQSQLAFTTLFSVIGDIQNGLKNVPGGDSIRRVLLNRSIEKLESTATSYIDQAAVDRHSVIALNDLGDIALTLRESTTTGFSLDHDSSANPSVNDLANSFYQRAYEIATQLSLAEPEAIDIQRLLAASNRRLGEFYLKTGRSEQAKEYLDAQHRLASELVAASPDNPENRQVLASSFDQQGALSLVNQNATRALEQYEAARDIRIDLKNEFPDDLKNRRQLSRSLIRINEVMLQLGRVDDGLVQLENAQQTLQKMIAENPENSALKRDLLVSLEREGDIFQALRRFEDAQSSYEEALDLGTGMLDLEPENLEYMMTKSISHQKLGRLLLNQNKLPDALKHYKQSIELDEAIVEVQPLDVMANDGLAVSLGKRGEISLRRNETEQALEDFTQSLAIRKKIADADPDNLTLEKKLSVSYQRLGTYFVQTGDLESALSNHNESYKICKRLAELDPANDSAQRFLLSNHEHLAIVFEAMGQPERAVAELEKMVAIGSSRATAHPDHPGVNHDYLYSCHRLAQTLQTTRDLKQSLEVSGAAVKHASTFLSKNPASGIEAMQGELEKCGDLAQLRMQAIDNLDDLLADYSVAANKLNVVDQPEFTLASLLRYRAESLVENNEFELAAETAIKISELDTANHSHLVESARLLARCAAGLKQSKDLKSEPADENQQGIWLDQSIAILKKAISEGWDEFDELQSDPELKILHDLPKFKALLN